VINDSYHLSIFPVMVIIDKNYLSRFKLIAKNTGIDQHKIFKFFFINYDKFPIGRRGTQFRIQLIETLASGLIMK